MRYEKPLFARLFSKLVLEVMPTALASLVGGILIAHFQFARAPEPAVAAAPASAEMMQLLRDEHGLMVNFLEAQLANEKKALATASEPGIADGAGSETAISLEHPVRLAAAAAAARTPARAKTSANPAIPAAGAPLPLVVAQIQPNDGPKPAARADESLLARTIGIKDNVVAVTHRVVTVIGDIPSLIGGAIGDRIGGDGATRPLSSRFVSAS